MRKVLDNQILVNMDFSAASIMCLLIKAISQNICKKCFYDLVINVKVLNGTFAVYTVEAGSRSYKGIVSTAEKKIYLFDEKSGAKEIQSMKTLTKVYTYSFQPGGLVLFILTEERPSFV